MAEFRNKTSEAGSCEETTAKEVITLQTAMTKKVVIFLAKKGDVTSSVATPGVSNPSDATEAIHLPAGQWTALFHIGRLGVRRCAVVDTFKVDARPVRKRVDAWGRFTHTHTHTHSKHVQYTVA